MRPEITEKQWWYEVDGTQGTMFYSKEYCGCPMDARKEYPGEVYSIEAYNGHGARLSMPGYLDCTDWIVFDTEAGAAQHLLDMYYDAAEDETSPEDEAHRTELEAIATAVPNE